MVIFKKRKKKKKTFFFKIKFLYLKGKPNKARRAIQLGIKNVKTFADGTDLVLIEDISEFVGTQRKILLKGAQNLFVSKERVYQIKDPEASENIFGKKKKK